MGKSIRSKIKKRLRTAKRQRIDAMIITPREKEHNEALHRVMEGRAVLLAKPKNAFKYPKEAAACFPQHEIVKPIDFRAQNLPMAGYVFRGNRRKYEGEQADYMTNLAKAHPKMEVLAGGGAVLAQDGRRISKHEADILATAAAGHPEAAAAAASQPATAASAVAAALAEADAEMSDIEENEQPDPEGQADHTRRPVVKDARRAARVAEHRPRAKTSSKKKAHAKGVQAKAEAAAAASADVGPSEAAEASASDAAAPAVAAPAVAPAAAPAAPAAAEVATKAAASTAAKGEAAEGSPGKVKNKLKKKSPAKPNAKADDDMQD